MKDESRHVAFGVLALRDYYRGHLRRRSSKDREDFIIYACELMREPAGRRRRSRRAMGWNEEEDREGGPRAPTRASSSASMLFMRIVPNLKKLGLITPRVREAFVRTSSIIQFEDLDPEAQDRELGLA